MSATGSWLTVRAIDSPERTAATTAAVWFRSSRTETFRATRARLRACSPFSADACAGRMVVTYLPLRVTMKTMSARDFNRDMSAAKRAADDGPVVITDRGEPAYVLLSFADYRGLGDQRSLVDVLQMDDDVDFEPVISRALPREL